MERRMEYAKQQLANGECVKSIAYSMGFAAPSNFSAAFRRATGETPRDYRARLACGAREALLRSAASP